MRAQGLFFDEPARRVPLITDADVIVCGAGPAGVAAAIAAARAGARTRLFEVHGCLGGGWIAEAGVLARTSSNMHMTSKR